MRCLLGCSEWALENCYVVTRVLCVVAWALLDCYMVARAFRVVARGFLVVARALLGGCYGDLVSC